MIDATSHPIIKELDAAFYRHRVIVGMMMTETDPTVAEALCLCANAQADHLSDLVRQGRSLIALRERYEAENVGRD